MIESCLALQGLGLGPPKAVSAATDDYMAAEDAIGRWLDERSIKKANAKPEQPISSESEALGL